MFAHIDAVRGEMLGVTPEQSLETLEVYIGSACRAGWAHRHKCDSARRTRRRAVLMIPFASILGVVPLMLATGAGAEMRQSLGTAVFSGMLAVTLFGLLFTPVFYVACRRLARALRARHGGIRGDPMGAER